MKIEDTLDPHFEDGTFVVPNEITTQIEAALDSALRGLPDDAEEERQQYRNMLLRFVNEHGYVPEFTLERREQ